MRPPLPPSSQPESPPPPPLAPLQTTTSLSKSMYSVVRRTHLLLHPLLSLLPSDLCAEITLRPLEAAQGARRWPSPLRPPHLPPPPRGLWVMFVLVSSFSFSLGSWFLPPPEPPSPSTPFSSLKSQVQFRRTAFSCPKQKGKGKEERNFRPLVRLQEEKEQHQNHKGKEKPSFLGNAHDLLSRYLDKSFLRKKKKENEKQHRKNRKLFS